MFGLNDLVTLEAAVRRVENLANSPALSAAARDVVAFAASDLVGVFDLSPGPVAQALAGDAVDVHACVSTCIEVLENLVVDLCDPVATGMNPMDVVTISAAVGEAHSYITSLAPLGV